MNDLQNLADQLDTANKRFTELIQEIYALIDKQSRGKQQPRANITADSVANAFTEEQHKVLRLYEAGDIIKVEFNQRVEKVIFADVANRVKGCGGEWVSDGKNSHFKIPK